MPDVTSALMASYRKGIYSQFHRSLCLFLHILGRCRQALSGSQRAGTCIAGCASTSLQGDCPGLQFTSNGLHSVERAWKSVQSLSGTVRHINSDHSPAFPDREGPPRDFVACFVFSFTFFLSPHHHHLPSSCLSFNLVLYLFSISSTSQFPLPGQSLSLPPYNPRTRASRTPSYHHPFTAENYNGSQAEEPALAYSCVQPADQITSKCPKYRHAGNSSRTIRCGGYC